MSIAINYGGKRLNTYCMKLFGSITLICVTIWITISVRGLDFCRPNYSNLTWSKTLDPFNL